MDYRSGGSVPGRGRARSAETTLRQPSLVSTMIEFLTAFRMRSVGICLGALMVVTTVVLLPGMATAAARPIMDMRLAQIGSRCDGEAPVTFGQPFRPGDVPAGSRIAIRSDGSALPTQTDIKARNADGSVRHAVISVDVPCSVDRKDRLQVAAVDTPAQGRDIRVSDVLGSGFNSRVEFNIDGHPWHVDADALLKRIAGHDNCDDVSIYCRHWLDGPLAGEWVVGAPPVDDKGRAHPRLMVFFAVRAYGPAPVSTVRVDVTVENDWAYAAQPHDLTYDARVSVAGQPPSDMGRITHFERARWHKVLWWGHADGPVWFAALNGPYLQATPAVPAYQDIDLSPSMLASVRQSCAPMDHCDVMTRMEATGAQPQIGPLPQWSSAYIVNPHDYRTYRWMLADSDALGAYGTHYRQQDTDEALSVQQHPCATLVGPAEMARCRVPPHGDDRIPWCHGACSTPLQAEPAHHGAPAYVAYLVTGDWYYAQELTFWTDWTIFTQNPEYRGYRAGLVNQQQVRSQAWDLRTLGDAAYLLPDDSPFKTYFNDVATNNIRWYNKHYSDSPDANRMGFLSGQHAVLYPYSGAEDSALSPWQQSFFTWAAGNLVDQGFRGAKAMRDYFSRFQIGTLTAHGFCPEMATAYTLRVRDSRKAPYYKTFAQIYDRSFGKLADVGCDPKALNSALRRDPDYDGFNYPPGTMVGYPDSGTGFVANFQIGLAAAADANDPQADEAWRWFMNRPVRPDYSEAPQFAVVPSRKASQ